MSAPDRAPLPGAERPALRRELPRTPSSARAARDAVRRHLGATVAPCDVESAVLVTSELVTNAVRHAAGEALVLTAGPGATAPPPGAAEVLRLGVADGCDRPARLVEPYAGGGRGMLVVEQVAIAWGTQASGAGKVVWAEVALRHLPGA